MIDTILTGQYKKKFFAYRIGYSFVSEIGVFYNQGEAETMLFWLDKTMSDKLSDCDYQIVLSDRKLDTDFFNNTYPILSGKYGFKEVTK